MTELKPQAPETYKLDRLNPAELVSEFEHVGGIVPAFEETQTLSHEDLLPLIEGNLAEMSMVEEEILNPSSEVIEMPGPAPMVISEDLLWDSDLLEEIEAIPDRMAFKIGEAADILKIRPYVLRYWETEFDELRPKKSNHNQRMYSRNDVKVALMIKKLLYRDRFSIEGARKALKKMRSQVKQEGERRSVETKKVRAFDKLHSIVDDLQRLKRLFA